MGVRIHQLAKELGMTSKELMTYLRTQGHKVTNHMCTVEETVAQILRDRLPKKIQEKKAAEESKRAKKKKKARAAENGGGDTSPKTTTRKKGGAAADVGKKTTTQERGRRSQGTEVIERGAAGGGRAPDDDGPRPKPKDQRPTRKRFFPGAGSYGYGGGDKRIAGGRGRPGRRSSGGVATAVPRTPTEATVQLPITLKDLSAEIGVKVSNLIRFLMRQGLMLNMNSYVDEEVLEQIGQEFSVKIDIQREKRLEDAIKEIEGYESPAEELFTRAPVVTFLGHVDHGKTSLLDHIRNTRVVSKEHGGITQHLAAYRVDDGDVHVVFIDTPGHKAFTEMRARGTNATDVAVLIVAADEGPMPQTEEAYNHAVAANVPIIVAINKIDKPNANPNMVKEKMSHMGLMPVEWGGKTEFVEVSATTGQGVDNLLEVLSLESEILELKANPSRDAVGVVLEAQRDPGRGILATVLVQDGTLRLGDHVLCGSCYGRLRSMWLNGIDLVEEAGPSTPVQISGLNELPEVGDKLYVFDNGSQARQIAEERSQRQREEDRASSQQRVSLDNIWKRLEESEVKELNLIIKADVKGTLEALRQSLEDAGNEEVQVKILHTAVGAISQDDVVLADASRAVILGFNVGVDERAKGFADEKQIEVRTYNVIYELLEDVKKAIEDRLSPELREEFQGRVEIQQVFRASRIGNIAGCIVRKGKIQRDSKIRLIRNDQVIHSGTLSSLKRFSDDVKEVREGYECGLKIAGFNDIQEGDVVEAYTIIAEKRTL